MEEDYNSRLNKMQKEEYLIKNACYSVTKYYLCKQNNKRSLLGRKQRNQVTRSFLNRYQFSSTNKVTSLFSTSCILRIILEAKRASFTTQKVPFYNAKGRLSLSVSQPIDYQNITKLQTKRFPLFKNNTQFLFCKYIS